MKILKMKFWQFGLLITIVSASVFAYKLFLSEKSLFLMGETTHGHHQIEMECSVCHIKSFGGKQSLQESCVDCHGKDLQKVNDSHPKTKFTDPRNSKLLASLDARLCVTCHQEHRPEITRKMGVTLADDFCFHCHKDIGEDRVSHNDYKFDSCASAGCHNFHDNTALYEDFLAQHINGPATLKKPLLTQRTKLKQHLLAKKTKPVSKPDWKQDNLVITKQWKQSTHALVGVNCSECHKDKNSEPITSTISLCADCHSNESESFLMGKHGMRLAQNLSPMSPAQARLPMQMDSHDKNLNCGSCHNPHSVNTVSAAVESCLSCHADKHSLAYKDSPHYKLWQKEINNKAKLGTGVSCASCHMPRLAGNKKSVFVDHNQNNNLRPNEKMVRSVCINCHSVDFSLQALASESLIQSNFSGKPENSVATMELIKSRQNQKKKSQQRTQPK